MRIYQILILLVLASCGFINNKENSSNTQAINETDDVKISTLIILTVNLPALQQYYKVQETIDQRDFVIMKNEFIKKNYKLDNFNQPIKILDKTEIQQKNIKAFLEYKNVTILNDTAFIYYRYDIQGLGIESSYLFKSGDWELLNYRLWEN